jgi:acyl-CoA synthetase (NDP forming)
VIVAGASAKNTRNPGSIILGEARLYGVKEIYALHPTSKDLFGIPAYPNLAKLAEIRKGKPADLLTIVVPANESEKLLNEALKYNSANSILILSAGFGETKLGWDMDQRMRNALTAVPLDKRPVVNGPNTVGNRVEGGINTCFIDASLSNSDWRSGKRNCALLCQSGAFMVSTVSDVWPAITPGVAVSVGNQLDLTVVDLLEFYLEDPKLTTFALYLEGLTEAAGIRLMNLVRRARDLDKAVVLYKAGRTDAGRRATRSHTASKSNDYDVFSGLLDLAGGLVASSLDEWLQLVIITTLCPTLIKPKKKSVGVAVLTNAGYEKCAAADHLTGLGEDIIHLPKWSPDSTKEIAKMFKKYKIEKIVDIGEVLDVTPLFADEGYYDLMKIAFKDPDCDVGFVTGVPETQSLRTQPNQLDHPKSMVSFMKKLKAECPEKPLILAWECDQRFYPLRKALNQSGIPCFSSPDSVARALRSIIRQARRK